MADLTISEDNGIVCCVGFEKALVIPLRVSFTRGHWVGGWRPASWWKWFTAATIAETTEVDFFSDAKAEMTASKCAGADGRGGKPRSVEIETKVVHNAE